MVWPPTLIAAMPVKGGHQHSFFSFFRKVLIEVDLPCPCFAGDEKTILRIFDPVEQVFHPPGLFRIHPAILKTGCINRKIQVFKKA
jgi:hypothetical protein